MAGIGVHGGASSGGGGGGAVTVADGADVAEGATTDAAVTTDVAGTISAKLRGLLKILDRMIGLESDTTIKSYSLQIGGAAAPGGEWHAATTTNTNPGATAYGLVTRDPSAISVNSGALNTTGYGINAYSRSDSAVHSVESRDSKPLGTEYGLLTRNIYDTQISQLHNTIANPTRSLQLGGADVDGGTHRHVGVSNAEPAATGVGMFVRNISGMGTPGAAVIGQVNVVAGRDPNTNVVRQIEVLTAAPAGTEGGVLTRNIPSGTQDTNITKYGGVATTLGQKTSAASIPVVLPSDAHPPSDLTGTGSITAVSQSATLLTGGTSSVSISITGVWVGTLIFVGVDQAGALIPLTSGVNMNSGAAGGTTSANGSFLVPSAGWSSVGVFSTAWTSGTATISMIAGVGVGVVSLARQLPTGTNVIGSVNLITGQTGIAGGLSTWSLNTTRTIESRSNTSAVTSVATSVSSVTLLASNTARLGAMIYNRCSTQALLVKFGTTASLTDFSVRLLPTQYYEVPSNHTGRIDGIWEAAGAESAQITEFT